MTEHKWDNRVCIAHEFRTLFWRFVLKLASVDDQESSLNIRRHQSYDTKKNLILVSFAKSKPKKFLVFLDNLKME